MTNGASGETADAGHGGGGPEPAARNARNRYDESAQLEKLAQGMRRVARGHFDTKLEDYPGEPFHSIFHDFNHMTESLLGVEALRESFVSNVAHEFKTPLSYIQGYALLLQDDDLPQAKRDEYVGHINSATRHLSNMIGNLLEISNLSRPNAQLEVQRFSLDEQLRHIMAMVYPQIVRKGLDYELELEEVDVEGNESLLEDAWMNLIANAVKYTQAGGAVVVTLERRSHQAIVKVCDTGCGMTEDQVKHAFDRFYQGESSHVSEGSGLGLAIVKAVVKKHNGTVSVRSKLLEGTEFTVIIPLRQIANRT